MTETTNFKKGFYRNYSSSHVIHRKGIPSTDEFAVRAAYYDQRWLSFFPQDRSAKVIDVGCGNGSLVWWLQKAGYQHAAGVDVSSEQIETAQRLGVQNVIQGDLKDSLASRSAFYDVIVLRDVLEHFKRDEIIELLSASAAALSEQGRIIIQVPNAESPFFGRVRYGDFTHEIAFSSNSLAQLLRNVGLNNIRFYPTDPAIFGLKSLLRYVLWKLVAAFYQVLLFAELGPGRRIVTQGIIAVATKE